MFAESGIPGTLVRYADDFVILLWRDGEEVLAQVRQMLARLGLELHGEKTRILHAKDGFDFLGIHFRLCKTRKRPAKVRESCRIWPSHRSMERIKARLKEAIGCRTFLSLERMIGELNPIIRGWHNYHTTEYEETERFRKLNYFVRERLRIFLRRKYGDQSRGGTTMFLFDWG